MTPESLDKVTAVAVKAGLDIEKFKQCLVSPEAFASVENTNKMVMQQGVNSTPVFIVNNAKLARGVRELEEVLKK